MKKFLSLLLFFSTMVIMNAQDTPISAFLEKWENSKSYLIELAEAMPEEKFSYKPTEREMDFKSQLLHIRGNMLWLSTTYFSSEKFDRAKLAQEIPTTKAATIELLKTSFDFVSNRIKASSAKDLRIKVDFFAGEKTKLQILNLLQDHVTHHRGQLIVYLNLNEIKPPRYVGW